MTRTGIIGLVVLIVVVIGGYSIISQSGDDSLGNNATSTEQTGTTTEENATTTDEEATSTEATTTDEAAMEDGEADQASAEITTEEGADQQQSSGQTQAGIGGSAQAAVVQNERQTEGTRVEVASYSNADLGVSFEYPATWNVDESDNQIVAGKAFAGGMKAEMTSTVHENVELSEIEDLDGVDASDLQAGDRLVREVDCKSASADCAGAKVFIIGEGETDEDGWNGNVVEVNYGVFEMPDHEGPDSSVSPDELLEVSGSVFTDAVNSIQVSMTS